MSRFFSDEAYEPQVDPFNAGEPVMPWDDPESLHDDGSCDLPADGGYTAEEKPKDDYRAPERPESKRPAAQRNAQPAGNAPKQPTPPRKTQPDNGAPQQPAARSGKPGCQRSFHRVFVLVVVIVMFINAFGSCASDVFDDVSSDSDASDDAALDYSQEQMNADEQAIANIITERMDGLADDPATMELAKQGLNSKLKSYVGYTAEELGIDADAYAAWFFSQMSYQISYAYTYDDGTGIVAVEIASPLAFQIASSFYDKASDYLMDNELYGSYDDDTVAAPLTSEQQDRMRGFFADVLTDTEPSDNGYMSVAAIKGADGAWQLSESAIKGELNYLLGVN